MELIATAIPEVKLVRVARHADGRGSFSETWNRGAFRAAGIDVDFVQDNRAVSLRRGTLRGLHFQRPPAAQAKLVRVERGAIFDVCVDLRQGSPSYGRHLAQELIEDGDQLFVPVGFAHGYCTLSDDTVVAYKVDAPYAPEHEGGLAWDDPALGIDWPLSAGGPILGPRDRSWPRLAELPAVFGEQP